MHYESPRQSGRSRTATTSSGRTYVAVASRSRDDDTRPAGRIKKPSTIRGKLRMPAFVVIGWGCRRGHRVACLSGGGRDRPSICAISQRLSRRGGTVVTAARYRRMELMGCPPLSLPTLDPRSYRMEPRQGKKRRKQSELSRLRGRWEQRFMTPAVHGGPRGLRAGRAR